MCCRFCFDLLYGMILMVFMINYSTAGLPEFKFKFLRIWQQNISGKPLTSEIQVINRDEWGFYNSLPGFCFFNVSQVLHLYNTFEELNLLT